MASVLLQLLHSEGGEWGPVVATHNLRFNSLGQGEGQGLDLVDLVQLQIRTVVGEGGRGGERGGPSTWAQCPRLPPLGDDGL